MTIFFICRSDELLAAKQKAEFFLGLLEARTQTTSLPDKYAAISACHPISNKITSPRADCVRTLLDNSTSSTTKDIFNSQRKKCETEIRKELFEKSGSSDDRKNSTTTSKQYVNKSYDDIVRYHDFLQEQVTNEMVELARNLKSNITISNEIVRKDTELLETTNKFAEGTVNRLKANTSRISKFANAACEYWLWICLFLVTTTFFSMVIFIRLFPKKQQPSYYFYNDASTAAPIVTTTPKPYNSIFDFIPSDRQEL